MKKRSNIQLNTASLLEELKAKSKREANLFFSLCENGENFVHSKKLIEALNRSGLQLNDNRLQNLFRSLRSSW